MPELPARLAHGVELIGRYEGSGFKDPPWIARRGDGQTIQLSELLYLVAEEADGKRESPALAEAVTQRFDKQISADQAGTLVERLRNLGVLAAPDGSSPKLQKPDPLLALRFRAALVNPQVVRTITGIFRPLFFPPVILGVLAGVVVLDVWLFGTHGVGDSLHSSLYQPALLLLVFGLVIAGAAFHEFGHAVACRYGGATPGVMGAGIYLAWPAFYTDVTDAYRLGRAGRLRTDLGGVYFNLVVILLVAGVYFATGFEPLLLVVAILHFEIVHQLLPFIRLDGYYIVADLTGVPDLFSRLRPILTSLIPFREPDKAVTELRWWARAVATAWVLAVVPLLLFNLGILAVTFPRIVATAWDSGGQILARMDGLLGMAAGTVQLVALGLPLVGIVLTFARLGRRLALATWRRADGHPGLRFGGAAVAAAAGAFLVFTWLPDGDYEPVRRGERGTLGDYATAVRAAPRGDAGVVPLERSRQRGELDEPGEPAQAPGGAGPSEDSVTTTTTTAGVSGSESDTTALPARSSPTTDGSTATTNDTRSSTTTTSRPTTTTTTQSTTTSR